MLVHLGLDADIPQIGAAEPLQGFYPAVLNFLVKSKRWTSRLYEGRYVFIYRGDYSDYLFDVVVGCFRGYHYLYVDLFSGGDGILEENGVFFPELLFAGGGGEFEIHAYYVDIG